MTEQTEVAHIQNLQSSDDKTRFQAALHLAESGNPIGNKILCQAIDNLAWNDVNLYRVIDVLGEVGDDDCVDTLVSFLANFHGHARGNALATLLNIGTENAVNIVFDELATDSPWYGWGTAQLIADYGEKFLLQVLESSQNSNPLVRARSIYALGAMKGADKDAAIIEETLIKALKDADSEVRKRAAWGLSKLNSSAVHQALLHLLDGTDIEASQWAAEGLYHAGIEAPKSLELLIQTLAHKDFLIRRSAVWALQRINDGKSVPALVNLLKNDTAPGIRAYAAQALGFFQQQDIVKSLQEGLSDESELVRIACIETLTKILGETALPMFIPMQSDSDVAVSHTIRKLYEEYGFHPDTD